MLRKNSLRGLILRSSQGFTLIELLVVIAIIAVLASVILASLNTARIKARDARRLADIKQIQLALELYANDSNGYPTGTGGNLNLVSGLAPTYISTLPADPLNNGTEIYKYWSNNTSYVIQAQMENGTGAGTGNPSTATTSAAGGLACSTAGYYCVSS